MGFVYGSTFRLDDIGEVMLTSGNDISMVTEYEKIKQDLTVLLRSHKNQYIFNMNYGIDYREYLQSRGLNKLVNVDVMNALKSYYFVDSIMSLDATVKNGVLYIDSEFVLKNGKKVTIVLEV